MRDGVIARDDVILTGIASDQSASGIGGGKCESDDGVAECGAGPRIPAGGDDNELAPAGDIGHRCHLAASRQRRLPEFAALPLPLSVECHRLAATASECGSTGLIFGHPFQAEDEVGQDYLSSSEDFGLNYRILVSRISTKEERTDHKHSSCRLSIS